ncbi:HAD superfamily hydrolase (TIGR01509 family) [Streptomyces filamentosus]|uniref:HAD family hydrolase n=1 Tax=Streptomyces filamentosus TaxID=67294 RepID=UPI0033FE07B7
MTPHPTPQARGAALFDLDGTLVDTTYLHTLAWWQALRRHGHTVPMARIHRAIGMGSDRLLDAVLGPDHETGEDEALADAHGTLYATWYDSLQPFEGAAALLRATAARGWRIVLASSASEEEVAAVRARLDADDVIDAATSSADADATKPAPDLVRAALDAVGAEPGEAVLVGDTVWDVEAAGRAGVPCVGLLTGGTTRRELEDAGALLVYDDPLALLRHIDAGPLARPPAPGGTS